MTTLTDIEVIGFENEKYSTALDILIARVDAATDIVALESNDSEDWLRIATSTAYVTYSMESDDNFFVRAWKALINLAKNIIKGIGRALKKVKDFLFGTSKKAEEINSAISTAADKNPDAKIDVKPAAESSAENPAFDPEEIAEASVKFANDVANKYKLPLDGKAAQKAFDDEKIKSNYEVVGEITEEGVLIEKDTGLESDDETSSDLTETHYTYKVVEKNKAAAKVFHVTSTKKPPQFGRIVSFALITMEFDSTKTKEKIISAKRLKDAGGVFKGAMKTIKDTKNTVTLDIYERHIAEAEKTGNKLLDDESKVAKKIAAFKKKHGESGLKSMQEGRDLTAKLKSIKKEQGATKKEVKRLNKGLKAVNDNIAGTGKAAAGFTGIMGWFAKKAVLSSSGRVSLS